VEASSGFLEEWKLREVTVFVEVVVPETFAVVHTV